MNLVNEIIRNFSNHELREFRYFLNCNSNAGNNKETIKLVELIRKGKEENIAGNNAYHQTKKRIKRKIEQFVSLENYRFDPTSRIQNFTDVAKYLFRKNMYVPAWDYLFKAEQLAKKYEEYEMLDFIYFQQISCLSGTPYANIPDINVHELLEKRDANLLLSQVDGNANAAYALLLSEIKDHLSKEVHFNIDKLVDRILKRYKLEDKIDEHPRIYSKIVNILCRGLREKKDYESLKVYAMKSYGIMEQKKMLDRIPPDFLMELLRSIYQAAIRTIDFKSCEKFQLVYQRHVNDFKQQADKFIYYDFRSNIMAADLYMCTNRLPKARTRLLELDKKYGHHKQSAIVYFLLRINLLAVHFKYGEFKLCEKIFNDVIRSYEKKILKEEGLGLEMMLFTEIFGTIFYYENGDLDYTWYLLKRIRRKYADTLNHEADRRNNTFLRILEKLVNDSSYLESKKFANDHDKFVKLKQYIPGDKEYISLNAWLSSKLTGKSYYECFLKQFESGLG